MIGTFVWQWPQITLICISVFQALLMAILDGKPRTGTHRLSIELLETLIFAGLLYAGGFFTVARP